MTSEDSIDIRKGQKDNPHRLSYSGALIELLVACIKAGFIIGFVLALLLLVNSSQFSGIALLPALGLFGMILGPIYAIPAILMGAGIVVCLSIKGPAKRYQLVLAGLATGGLYGLLKGDIHNPADLLMLLMGGTLAGFFIKTDDFNVTFKLRHWITLTIVVSVFLIIHFAGDLAYLLRGQTENDLTILHKQIGQHALYIPRRYTYRYGLMIESKGGSIDTFYPGAAPVPVTKDELHSAGSDKLIITKFTDMDQIPAPFHDEGIARLLKDFMINVYEIGGQEYGLIHYRPSDVPENAHKSRDEFWVEEKNKKPVAFIKCDTQFGNPNCSYYFQDDRFRYWIDFRKSHLSDWNAIRNNVLAMMDSFQSEQSARNFLINQNSK